MATIEDVDTELADGSATLLLPVGEEQPPEEQEASPLPLLNHAQYGGRIFYGCSLFGCNHVIEGKGDRYCSKNHQKLAEFLSSQDQAYVVVDGFLGNDKCFLLVLSLLKRVEHSLDLGIPQNKDLTIFESHPRQWKFIDLGFLEEETDRAWLFFHSKSNPEFRTFSMEGQGMRWSRSRRFVHKYCNFDGIKSTVSYMRLDSDKKTDVRGVDADPLGLKGWALTEYSYKGQSLFCLSFSSGKKSIFSTEKECSRKRVSSDPGSRKKKTTKNSSQPSLISEDDPMKMLLLDKKRELEAIYVKAHMHVSEDLAKLIDPCVSDSVSDLDSTQLSDSISILDGHLELAKLEASSREAILLAVEKLIHAKREEEWYSEYTKRGNLFSLLSGDEKTLERATNAKRLVSEIPSMIVLLSDTVNTWETERGTSFLYDKHMLLHLLNEEKR